MCYKGEALSLYISDQDGISVPASNIMDSIDEAKVILTSGH
jgi:hypothetical protein